MRQVLLTSSQVSLLLSSGIIFLCTLALFLSGYVIQQRTLRELRVAVRPRQSRPSPNVYLPDHFKRPTTKLEDGTVIVGESEADKEAREHKDHREAQVVEIVATEEHGHANNKGVAKEKLAMLEAIKAQAADKAWAVDNPDPASNNHLPVTRAERRRMIKDEIQRLSQTNERTLYQRRLW
ncbi:hypothetical protein B0I35DRAFT_433854 [Stachybotrys elegans]|uniref:Uncharacterized protein n=1 Tax=Stachybotrys elegans TaxID=80388 RepID=A0A8K0SKD3_9HYPO|nr:hypothetical protein B0I35DRAFT_433854 [Stachybotrys elegans]